MRRSKAIHVMNGTPAPPPSRAKTCENSSSWWPKNAGAREQIAGATSSWIKNGGKVKLDSPFSKSKAKQPNSTLASLVDGPQNFL
jgi:hypothetical protein